VIRRIVAAALRAPAIVLFLALALAAAGLWARSRLDIEAYPDPIPPMVEVISQPRGWSAEDVERFVTVPLEIALQGMPGLEHVRSQSLFELSDIKCYFAWGTRYADARQEVLNRLGMVQLPGGTQPGLSPWSPVGEVFRYVLRGKGYSLEDLKTAQDWILERQLRRVPGVVDVVGFGGETRQYHVEIQPVRLKAHGLGVGDVTDALAAANQDVGGQFLRLGEQSFVVRGVGLIRSLGDIEEVVVASHDGTPVRVRDVAEVQTGPAPRLGVVGHDDDPDVVQGIVLMRYGGNTMETIKGIHARLERVRKLHLLPPGMEVAPYYDRSQLVHVTTRTVLENLITGMLLVTGVLWLFLRRPRIALATAVNVPLALLGAFLGMVATGSPANLISLGAVDFGIVIDSTVIMMENIVAHAARGAGGDGPSTTARIVEAAGEVGPPMLSSTLVIGAAFLPLFTLTGVAGVVFAPMAHTYAFAIGTAIVCALTLTPVLARFALRRRGRRGAHGDAPAAAAGDEPQGALMAWLQRVYGPLFDFGLQRKKTAVALALVPVAVAAVITTRLGGEFMPKLEEGNFWIRATFPTSIALEKATGYVDRIRRIVRGCPEERERPCDAGARAFPEIESVISQVGRPDDGTDVSGFSNIELLAPLRPRDEWRRGVTKERLTQQLQSRLREAFPGVVFNFSQAILDNVEEALSGVKGENTVKVVGPDLAVNEQKAAEIATLLGRIRGVEDLGVLRSLGQPGLRITPDRARAARYGLNVGDVEAVVAAAVGGQAATQVYEGDKHFDLTVRWAAPYRKDPTAIAGILVPTEMGAQVPLGQIAEISEEMGPAVIYREDGQRYTPVKFSVRGRDLSSVIGQSERQAATLSLPYDTHLEWAGEIDQLRDTVRRLMVIVPLTLLLIGVLVYSSVKSWVDTAIVFLGIPVAASGGILALWITGNEFSISAAMGFVSILGIAVQDALIVVTYARRLWKDGHGLEEGARLAAQRRLRPVLMTTFVAMLGLLPAAVSTGIGSETQKPLAVVVIGGALVLAVLPRLIQPPLLVLGARFRRRASP
jgi:cobalt-zinc-cadmium resistance protein CzcA